MISASDPISPGELHDEQVVALLRSGTHAQTLSTLFGEREYRELAQLARLAATRHDPKGVRVYILPGIMGSRLGTRTRELPLLWLHPGAVTQGALMQLALPGSHSLLALGVMLPAYLKMRLWLEIAGFRPILHGFDWRCDIDSLAAQLISRIHHADDRDIMLVGHSMGGLVARATLGLDRKGQIQRVVQLGAPNRGSFAPVQAMRASYPTVRKLASLDRQHSAEQIAQKVFRTLPGLYDLFPDSLAPGDLDLFAVSSWPQDELTPDVELLQRARATRSRLPAGDERCHVIAGTAQQTVIAAKLQDNQFEYLISLDGDGTVPRERTRWDGARQWYAHENHGALPLNEIVLAGLADVLRAGETQHLSRFAASSAEIIRRISDRDLRQYAQHKVAWDTLSIESRRRILEPVFTAEFAATNH
jgi:pimeloyl-ACP methyl ester carboxylesterase